VSVTAIPSITHVAVHGLAASTVASVGLCNQSAAHEARLALFSIECSSAGMHCALACSSSVSR
jgi:hypothetical protein